MALETSLKVGRPATAVIVARLSVTRASTRVKPRWRARLLVPWLVPWLVCWLLLFTRISWHGLLHAGEPAGPSRPEVLRYLRRSSVRLQCKKCPRSCL